MARQPLGLRAVRWLALVLLRCYPREFRRRHRTAFVETAEHRWRRELEAGGHGVRATLTTGVWLCADTLGAAPVSWRSRGGARQPHGPPLPSLGQKERLLTWIAGLSSDVRVAMRLMGRQPLTAALVVVTLALGIGVSTAAFSALDRVALRPLPFEHGGRMRYLALLDPSLGWQIAPEAAVVERWRQGSQLVEQIEIHRNVSVVHLADGPAEILTVTEISVGLPGMLGVRPRVGRMLTEGDTAADAPPAVMVAERFWRTRLGGTPDVIGRRVRFRSQTATIVGVWPGNATFGSAGMPDFVRMISREQEAEDAGWTLILATLRPGIEDEAAQAELASLVDSQEVREGRVVQEVEQAVVLPPRFRPTIVPATGFVADAYLQGVWLVFAGGLALFVVAVVSASNLLLGRAIGREGELGIRTALGGSRTRIVRLFAAESALLTGAGIAAGLGIAALTTTAYAAWDPRGLVADRGAWLDMRTMAFGTAAAVVAMLLATIVPAWRSGSADVRGLISSTGHTRSTDGTSRLRAALVGAQAALAVLLAAGALLTGRSFQALASVDPGFEVDRLAMVAVSPPQERYPTADARSAFIDRVRDAIVALPRVERVTVTNAPPFSTSAGTAVPLFEGETASTEAHPIEVATQSVDADYFSVFGTPLVAGRLFEPGDDDQAIIINESFARQHGGAAVLGRRLWMNDREGPGREVVGIVADVTPNALTQDPTSKPQLYRPRVSDSRGWTRFIVRVDGDPATVVRDVRARVAAIDSTVPLSEASTVRDLFWQQTARHRFVAYLLSGLALFGVVFAIAGVYGVVALDVARRIREVGLRVALGATTGQVIGRIVTRGLRPVVAGAGVGLLLALWTGPFLESLLFQVSTRDPLSVTGGVMLVVVTAGVACLLPARRAARVDPAITLRTD